MTGRSHDRSVAPRPRPDDGSRPLDDALVDDDLCRTSVGAVTRQDWTDMVRMMPAALLVLLALWAFCVLLFAMVPGPVGA